mmetsp:Transcript_50122/g.116379  ORF Transcript_50122/g.116379 Transcript_50122/m.116379 type:complete len:138 (-) Transcript_50122:1649-2062(-)
MLYPEHDSRVLRLVLSSPQVEHSSCAARTSAPVKSPTLPWAASLPVLYIPPHWADKARRLGDLLLRIRRSDSSGANLLRWPQEAAAELCQAYREPRGPVVPAHLGGSPAGSAPRGSQAAGPIPHGPSLATTFQCPPS